MLARCYYTNNKLSYVDDYVLRLPKVKTKNLIVIYHNIPDMKELDFYYGSIPNFFEYKTIYTSEPSTIHYSPLDKNKICNSTFNINNINKILEIACPHLDILYVVLVITPNIVELPKPNNSLIQLINLNQNEQDFDEDLLKLKIKIKDTNISRELIGSVHDFQDEQVIIFIRSSKLTNFSNWIKYSFDGFGELEIFQDLILLTDPDIEGQVIGLKNLLDEIVTKEDFNNIRKKFLHTLNYYRSFLSHDEKNRLLELISSANMLFNITQNNFMCDELSNTNNADNLFSKSIKTIPNFISLKQSKTFMSNKIKISRNNKQINSIDELIKSDPLFNKSLDQYMSQISLSNWYEEYENNSCLGLLVNVQTDFSDRMGWTTDTINVKITNTLIARDQIYDGHDYFWSQNNCLDTGKMQTNLISGSGIGSGNSLIPLYINKFHWEVAKKYVEEQISISITQNPYLFKPIMLGIYFHILIKIISETIISGCPNPLIKSLIWVLLTIKKLNINFNSLHTQDIRIQLSDFFLKWLDNPSLYTMEQTEIFKIYENITRYNMKKEYKTKKDIGFLSVVDILNNSINKPNISDFENFVVFTKLPINTQINKLLKQADESYGFIDDYSPDLIELKNTIKLNEKFFKIQNMFEKLEFAQAIQAFTYQCFLSRTPKLKSRLESTIGLLDFTSQDLNDQMISDHLIKLNRIIG